MCSTSRGLNVTDVHQTQVGGQTVIDVYTNGHTVAPDLDIGLTGSLILTESNFLLV
jgi:hypothetical protein